jgi:hypothetical protein
MDKIFQSFWKSVLLTTVFVGITDIALAFTMQTIKGGSFPSKMLNYIAGHAIGIETSLSLGFWGGVLGLLFHFIISFCFTLLIFMLFPILKLQRLGMALLILFSCIYTVFVNLFMRYVVLPFTLMPPKNSITWSAIWPGWLIFTIIFSFPIFWAASKYYKKKEGKI